MPRIAQSWLAFAAMGAGVIHLALSSGAGLPTGIVPAVLGSAEFGWGVVVLAQNRLVVPRLAERVAFVPSLSWSLLLLVAVSLEEPSLASWLPAFPAVVSIALTLVIAAVLAWRRRHPTAASTAPSRPYRYLGGLMAGALVISALTTPALGATKAGIDNPHGNHGGVELPADHIGH